LIEVSGQASGRIADGSASKKLARFFISNFIKLVNLVPGTHVAISDPVLSDTPTQFIRKTRAEEEI
jgi:hypothetical protein